MILIKLMTSMEKLTKILSTSSFLSSTVRKRESRSNKKSGLGAFLNISKKQRVKIDFVLKDEKLSEVTLKDVPLNRSQSLMLRGIFNLLK